MQIHTCFTEELDTFIFTAQILPPYQTTSHHIPEECNSNIHHAKLNML